MNLRKVVDQLDLEILSGAEYLDREVSGGFASDLLSDVMANSQPGNIWVTLQIHINIIAVATMKELAAIIIVQGREPEKQALEKAQQEGICLLRTPMHTFNIVGELYTMGIAGTR
jgi:predicted transcriptional regulator